jgi:hypothetical protein
MLVTKVHTEITETISNDLPLKPFGHGPKGMHYDEYGMDSDDRCDYSSEDQSETGVTP